MVTVPVALLMARLGRRAQSRGSRFGNRDRAGIGGAVAGRGKRWAGENPRERSPFPAGHRLHRDRLPQGRGPRPALGLPLAAGR